MQVNNKSTIQSHRFLQEPVKTDRVELLRKVGLGIAVVAGSMLAVALVATLIAGIVFMASPAAAAAVGISFAAASAMVIASGTTLGLGVGICGTVTAITCCIFKTIISAINRM